MAESSCKQASAGLEVPALSEARSPATSARRPVPFGGHVVSRALPLLRARCLLAARHRGPRAHPGTPAACSPPLPQELRSVVLGGYSGI